MLSPLLDTKSLFIALLKQLRCDLVLDIGSRDGKQSLLFRDLLPEAKVVAFEANPRNYRKMAANPLLAEKRVTLSPCAVSNVDGEATFHIADADYDREDSDENNLGTSSLLVHPGLKTAESVTVPTVRLETLLRQPEYGGCQSVALWIDVESAEYWVLEGLGTMAERVQLIQVETARTPMRLGQKTYDGVSRLLTEYGFVELGHNLEKDAAWGDVVYLRRAVFEQRRGAVRRALFVARAGKALRVNQMAVRLKRIPFLYRLLRALFVRGV